MGLFHRNELSSNNLETVQEHRIDDEAGEEDGSLASTQSGNRSSSGATKSPANFGQEKHQRAISWTRVLFFFVLAGTAAALATVVYLALEREESDDFEAQVSLLRPE